MCGYSVQNVRNIVYFKLHSGRLQETLFPPKGPAVVSADFLFKKYFDILGTAYPLCGGELDEKINTTLQWLHAAKCINSSTVLNYNFTWVFTNYTYTPPYFKRNVLLLGALDSDLKALVASYVAYYLIKCEFILDHAAGLNSCIHTNAPV